MGKIGFVLPHQEVGQHTSETECSETNDPRVSAVLLIAREIHEKMQNQATSIVKHEEFSKRCGSKLLERLDKLYIKLYEPI